MASFDATCVFFIFAILGGIAKVHGFAIWKYIRYIQEELLIVLDLVETHMPLAR